MDLTAEVANELSDFFRMVRPLLSTVGREELGTADLDLLLRRRAAAQDAFLSAVAGATPSQGQAPS